ncbi:hypothetical protein SCHPADRAFT_435670 [Schizopora paradoxa]|uniref:Transmembrane protein n=1 Tax=Schizopora paradoxa TaxID=27342 RepID=A0A0H2S5D1_9AGAM|nr:hypothetical protein SCHPADRAFT_435670 [Schizopora paradoxa]
MLELHQLSKGSLDWDNRHRNHFFDVYSSRREGACVPTSLAGLKLTRSSFSVFSYSFFIFTLAFSYAAASSFTFLSSPRTSFHFTFFAAPRLARTLRIFYLTTRMIAVDTVTYICHPFFPLPDDSGVALVL